MNPLRSRSALLAAFAAVLFSTSVAAQYPNRPVKLIVPFPAGGSTDIVGRLVAQKLSEKLGQPVVVENKGGAGGTVGTDVAAKSAPDGYTLTIGTTSTHAIAPNAYAKLAYDPVKEFAPLSLVAITPYLLVVNPNVKATNLKEFIALAKAEPGKMNYASAGNGTATHLSMEMLKDAAGIDIVHVPYKGNAPAEVAVLAGEVHAVFGSMPALLQQAKAGQAAPDRGGNRQALAGASRSPAGRRPGLSGLRVVALARRLRARGHAATDRRSPRGRPARHRRDARLPGGPRAQRRRSHLQHARGILEDARRRDRSLRQGGEGGETQAGMRFRWLAAAALALSPGAFAAQGAFGAPQCAADFDAMWKAVDQGYAYFGASREGWRRARTTWRPRAAASATRAPCAAALAGALETLRDDAVSLSGDGAAGMRRVPMETDIWARLDGDHAIVTGVRAGSVADVAGVHPGLVVHSVQGVAVERAVREKAGVGATRRHEDLGAQPPPRRPARRDVRPRRARSGTRPHAGDRADGRAQRQRHAARRAQDRRGPRPRLHPPEELARRRAARDAVRRARCST